MLVPRRVTIADINGPINLRSAQRFGDLPPVRYISPRWFILQIKEFKRCSVTTNSQSHLQSNLDRAKISGIVWTNSSNFIYPAWNEHNIPWNPGWFEDERNLLSGFIYIFSGELLLVSGSVYSSSLASFVNTQKLEISWLCCEIRPPKKKGIWLVIFDSLIVLGSQRRNFHLGMGATSSGKNPTLPDLVGAILSRRKIQYWEWVELKWLVNQWLEFIINILTNLQFF